MDYKTYLGYLSIAIALFSYVPYFWGIYRDKIKPHAFTWFVWGVLTGIGFVAQLISGGGSGSWVMLINSLLCLTVAGIGFYQKHVKYSRFDWLSLSGAFLALFFWWLTNNPLIAVILISLSDGIAILPTIRKAYYFPNEESVTPWAIGFLYYIIALFALETFTLTTWLYPATIVFTDLVFVLEVVVRRRQLAK